MTTKENDESAGARADRYDEELLSANWNPVIELLQASCHSTHEHMSREVSGAEDPDAFLKRFYRFV